MLNKKRLSLFVVTFLLVLSGCRVQQYNNNQQLNAQVETAQVMGSSMYYANSLEDIIKNEMITDILVVRFLTPGEYTIVQTSQTIIQEGIDPTPITSCGTETYVEVLEVWKGKNAQKGDIICLGESLSPDKDGTYQSKYISRKDINRAVVFTHYFQFDNSFVCPVPDYHFIMLDDNGQIDRDDITKLAVVNFDDCSAVVSEVDLRKLVSKYVAEEEQELKPWAQPPIELQEDMLSYFTKLLNSADVIPLLRSMSSSPQIPDPDLLLLGGAGIKYTEADDEALAFYNETLQGEAESALCINREEMELYWAEHTYSTLEHVLEYWFPNASWVYYADEDVWIGPDVEYDEFIVEEATCGLANQVWSVNDNCWTDDWIVHSLSYKYAFGDEHGDGECTFSITNGVIKVYENRRVNFSE